MGVIPSGMVRNAAMERGRSDFGRKLLRCSIAFWRSGAARRSSPGAAVSPETTSSGAMGRFFKLPRLQFPGETGRPPRPAAAPTFQVNMKKARPEREAADASSSGAAQILRSFFAMAIEEWRKLVADVARALGGKPSHPADTIEEKRFGDQ